MKKKKGRRRRKEGEEEDEKGDEPPLDVFARFATGFTVCVHIAACCIILGTHLHLAAHAAVLNCTDQGGRNQTSLEHDRLRE